MDAVRVLADEIGPRPACSGAESRAARWCAGHLAEAGLDVEVDGYDARPGAHEWNAAYFAVAAAGALLAMPLPLLSFVLGTAALVLYARDVEGRPLLPQRGGRSVNVLARPPGDRSPELVVVAQLDSPRASLLAGPHFAPGRRGWAVVVHAALVLVPVTGAAAWVAEAGRPLPAGLWAVAGLLAVPLSAAAAIELHAARNMPFTSGANDCATGVEVVMRLSSRFRDGRVWWLLAGSGNAGHAGIRTFLETHAHELGSARVLNIGPVGGGTISAAVDEGAMRLRRADGALIDAATEAGAEQCAYRVTQSAAAVAITYHRRALSLVGVDEHGIVPHQAMARDVSSNVERSTLDAAEDLAARIVAVTTGAVDLGSPRPRSLGDAQA